MLVVGFLILVWGLGMLLGAGVRCVGDTCVTVPATEGDAGSSHHRFTRDEVEDVGRAPDIAGRVGMVVGSLFMLGACGLAVWGSHSRGPVRAQVLLTPEQAKGAARRPSATGPGPAARTAPAPGYAP
ncbi:hypothetical protein [Streptomyces sp. NPDC048428]|uniref:hypothetical protein n=1 Tax=Streptomyces sp. NPDC048428 TaxID=3154503 RepID=UPI0034365A9D